MVIDDDPQFRNLIVAILRRDYLVSVAATGMEGYQKALEHTPDIAIIDIQMPEWDGLETLRAFRARPALQRVRIVMLTADTSRQTVMEAISLGADDYIVKTSLTKDDLLTKLQRVLKLVPLPQLAPGAYSQVSAPSPSAATLPVSSSVPAASSPNAQDNSFRDSPLSPNASATVAQDGGEKGSVAPLTNSSAEDDPRLQELLDAWE